jgi:hypothetical protein
LKDEEMEKEVKKESKVKKEYKIKAEKLEEKMDNKKTMVQKTLHIVSHMLLPLTMLPSKRNLLLLGRPLLVAVYQTTMKSV